MPSSFENKVIWWWILFLSSDKCYHIIMTRLTNMNLLNPHALNITNGARGIKNNIWVLDKTVKAKQNPESSDCFLSLTIIYFSIQVPRMGLLKQMRSCHPCSKPLRASQNISNTIQSYRPPVLMWLFYFLPHTHSFSLLQSLQSSFQYTEECIPPKYSWLMPSFSQRFCSNITSEMSSLIILPFLPLICLLSTLLLPNILLKYTNISSGVHIIYPSLSLASATMPDI